MKKQLISVMVAASLLTACGGAPKTTAEAEKFDYTVEQFADLQILRYRVPEFENLSLKQKELVYYLTEAALQGRDILFDQNGKYNLRIRRMLVPLVDTADGPSLLYEIRSATVRQPNEVCFPGGKTESGETAVQCALRETWEELSIPPEAVEVIGEMDFLHIRSNCLLRPVLGRVDGAALADIRPCAAEVADTFLVPLAWLRDHPPAVYIHRQPVSISDFPYEDAGISADYLWRPYYMEVPVYHGLPHPLWGLTARITMDVVAHL